MKLWTRVIPGNVIPAWMGRAWWDHNRDVCVCIVLPFNRPARWARLLWLWMQYPKANALRERLFAAERANEILRNTIGVEIETLRRETRTLQSAIRVYEGLAADIKESKK